MLFYQCGNNLVATFFIVKYGIKQIWIGSFHYSVHSAPVYVQCFAVLFQTHWCLLCDVPANMVFTT